MKVVGVGEARADWGSSGGTLVELHKMMWGEMAAIPTVVNQRGLLNWPKLTQNVRKVFAEIA